MRRLFLVLGILSIAIAISLSWFVPRAWLWSGRMNPESQTADTAEITIAQGWSTARVADELLSAKVIDSALGYRLYACLGGSANYPKPGVYRLRLLSNYRAIAQTLSLGPPSNEVQLTVVEGWTLDNISKVLEPYSAMMPRAIPDELRQQYAFLADLPKDASLEGYLFPNTYRVYADQLPQSLIKKQLDEFAKRAPKLMEEAKAQGKSLAEIVTLASIVEKEVSKPEDRAIVASIFWNRLDIGMPLQSDATVNYVTNAGRARPTLKDLEADSPYNTYRHKGLPPGPVSNPGDAALEAAVHPAQTDYHYFLTDDTGKTYFAKTFEGHQQNRQRAYGGQ